MGVGGRGELESELELDGRCLVACDQVLVLPPGHSTVCLGRHKKRCKIFENEIFHGW